MRHQMAFKILLKFMLEGAVKQKISYECRAHAQGFPRTRPGRRGRRTPSFSTDSTRAANSEVFPRARPRRRDPNLSMDSTRAANSKFFHGFDQGGKLRSFSTDSTRAARPKAFLRIRPGRRTPNFSTDLTRAANSEAFQRTRPGRRGRKLFYGFDLGGELQMFSEALGATRQPRLHHALGETQQQHDITVACAI